MFWVIQENLYNEEGFNRLLNALKDQALSYVVVKPIPFTDKFCPAGWDSWGNGDPVEPYINETVPIMVMGATTLNRICKNRGWTPGTFINDNFDFRVWSEAFGKDNCLNGDGKVSKLKDAHLGMYRSFVRPVLDDKSFAGTVMDAKEWHSFFWNFAEQTEGPLHGNTEILVALTQKISSEWRLWVVDGKIVTGSRYNCPVGLDDNGAYVMPMIRDFAKEMIAKWQPAEAYVIDIADTEFGPKVIEIGNINSAGFYGARVHNIVKALEDWSKK